MRELILGGARSGKSALAERLAQESGLPVTYIATATVGDQEMAKRIEQHQQQRPNNWQLIEEPIHLADVLRQQAATDRLLLVDCLTLWLSNLLLADDSRFEQQQEALLQLLPGLPGRLIMVSNEVGMGIVPMGEISRRFQDASGTLHQALAQRCERVILTVAGLPHILKGDPIC
ncbi:MAG: bifunctional adenosylcobinamide kinase/adenosylcobinamide-phosphate guanylyltransferase [Candidatus Polarisedimenticolaceae bacterium]|nr:bifunctional adenosylcobinamide kinase/adenosylcobinamide-phosphate guanylyltransferase [Candidatus Polarisedimenticolaceae bacterium]